MEVRSGVLPPLDACATVGRIASLLADHGERGLPAALELLVDRLELRSAVLREVVDGRPGAVLAVSGETLHAVPPMRVVSRATPTTGASAVIEVPVSAAGRHVATISVVGARPSQLPVLRACAAVLGLLDRRDPDELALALLADADADAHALADALHDGPVQDLVVARYAADAAVRANDPADARDAVQSALVALRRALWLLRPRGTSGGELPAALRALSDQLVSAGRPGLDLHVDRDAAAALPAQAASTAYRLVQSVLGDAPLTVTLRAAGAATVLEVDGGRPLPPGRWKDRARALGAELTTDRGRLRLVLPDPKAAP